MRKIVFVIVFLLSTKVAITQERGYFQQRVDYKIRVTLNDSLHTLSGFEKITYHNLSPDTISKLYIHLWANGYSGRDTKLVQQQIDNGNVKLYFAPTSTLGYISNLDFRINGNPINYYNFKNQPDIAILDLNTPLTPGDSLTIETPFFVKIPGEYSRMGHKGQSYQITQWFPKVAVYDLQGWHPMPYQDVGEFYSNFGSYDVSITLPENYYVAATGVMVDNKAEEERIEQRIRESTNSIRHNESTPISSSVQKTIRFVQDSIHDFAWFADKRFYIHRKEFSLSNSNQRVTAYAYFLPSNQNVWKDVPSFIEQTILSYSEKLGAYPYSVCTAVEGVLAAGGGMEYPMITVVNSFDKKTTERVIFHEVGHNWLYGIIGFNEREHPWLDEGINTFLEYEFFNTKYPNDRFFRDTKWSKHFNFSDFSIPFFAYRFAITQNDYIPMGLPSDKYDLFQYGISTYLTPVVMFRYLKEYIGATKFDDILLEFAKKWSFKHPTPKDLRQHFEGKTGLNLDWFFYKIANSSAPINQKIVSAKPIKNGTNTYVIKSKEISQIGAPYYLSAHNKRGEILFSRWVSPKNRIHYDTLMLPESAYKIGINQLVNIPEIDKRDNEMKIRGILKKVQLPHLSIFWRLNSPSETSLFYLPIIGWNSTDKMMFGMALYSDPIFPTKIDFILSPMYSISNQTLTGYGEIGYTSKSAILFLQSYRIGILSKQFGNYFWGELNKYSKIEPSLEVQFKTPSRLNILHQVKIREVYVRQTIQTPYLNYYQSSNLTDGNNFNYSVLDIQYQYQNRQKINPWSFTINTQIQKQTLKFSLDYKTQYTYAKKKGVDFRFFFGKLFNPPTDFLPNMNFYATGITSGYQGYNDYLFDQTLMGRSDNKGILSQQMIGNDGGFVTPTPLGRSNDWLVAVNLKANIPGKLPLALFFNIATFGKYSEILQNKEFAIYEAGVSIILIKDIAEVYFPLYISNDMQRVSDLNNQNFSNRIRFILNLNALNPLKAVKNYKQIIN